MKGTLAYGGTKGLVPSILLVLAQVIAFVLWFVAPLWIFTEASTDKLRTRKVVLRIVCALFTLLNCATARYLPVRKAWTWICIAAGVVPIALSGYLAGSTRCEGECGRSSHQFIIYPREIQYAALMVALFAINLILQLTFKVVYSGGKVIALFTGDLSLNGSSGHTKTTTSMTINEPYHDSPRKSAHSFLAVQTLPAWLMRLFAPLILLCGVLMVMAVRRLERTPHNDAPMHTIIRNTMSYVYTWNAMLLFAFALAAFFVSVRFSSRRRTVVVIFAGFLVMVACVFHFAQIKRLQKLVVRTPETSPGYIWAGFASVTLWVASACWSLLYKSIYDHSVCCCAVWKLEEPLEDDSESKPLFSGSEL